MGYAILQARNSSSTEWAQTEFRASTLLVSNSHHMWELRLINQVPLIRVEFEVSSENR